MDHAIDYSAFVLADRDNQSPHWKLTVTKVNTAACPDPHCRSKGPSNPLEVSPNGLLIHTVSPDDIPRFILPVRSLFASSLREYTIK